MSTTRLYCITCRTSYPLSGDRMHCDCGGLLDVVHDFWHFNRVGPEALKRLFDHRRISPSCAADRSGVWRFRELIVPDLTVPELVTRGEGNTRLYDAAMSPRANAWMGTTDVSFKHEGENPTGSFKDRGMTVAVSWAKRHGAKTVVCASTGNTSASVASYAALAGLKAVILISEQGTAAGKIAQSLAYRAKAVMIRGDFDQALKLVLAARESLGLAVMNSVNPVRLEGQKTIIWETLEQLGWDAPDWFVVPGGNLGNAAAFGKALREARELGLISKMPRLAVIQAAGANPLVLARQDKWRPHTVKAETIATAIKIGDPVNFPKAVRSLRWTDGVVTDVTDQEIMDAKAVLDSDGVGAEPASCATVAGIRSLVVNGVIRKDESVVAVLTGHLLKDPDATIGYHRSALPNGLVPSRPNPPVVINPTVEELQKVLAT